MQTTPTNILKFAASLDLPLENEDLYNINSKEQSHDEIDPLMVMSSMINNQMEI